MCGSPGALALLVDGQLTTAFARVVREQLTPLRACVDTDQTQTGLSPCPYLEWGPDQWGSLVADKMLPGVDTSGHSCVWLSDFRLENAGDQVLYAQVLETASDALLGNNLATLDVTVDEIPAIPLRRVEAEATHVGGERSSGDLKLNATFAYRGDLDLSEASLLIDSVLNEIQGAGELIPGVAALTGQSLVLQAKRGTRDWATFATPRGERPKVSATLQARHGELHLDPQMRDAGIMEPELCGARTHLTTEVVVLDAQHPPVDLKIAKPWSCEKRKHGQVSRLELSSHGRTKPGDMHEPRPGRVWRGARWRIAPEDQAVADRRP